MSDQPPTLEEIEAARTPAGGWTREQLATWGVPWPPPRGWKRQLIRREDPRVAELDRARVRRHRERKDRDG